ncbi:hypothetical protein ACFWM3_11705 [Gottfriedia sp. NPDC058432]|uniref:hypothetical protein n=1 Tax=Gottfriedia sp. NPDC058432 TaxID=3346497 RepID=UPI0036613040
MKRKTFWIPTIVFIVTTFVLYLCGYLFNIEYLKWSNLRKLQMADFPLVVH